MSNCFYGFSAADAQEMVHVCYLPTVSNDDSLIKNVTNSVKVDSVFGIAADLDLFWVIWASFLVFFMQTGFTLLEAGMVKHTNVQNIVFKNIMDTCISGVTFFLFGFCIAFGNDDSPIANGFIGTENVFLLSEEWNFYFFQWAFSTTAATIISGSVAERCTLPAYFIYTAWLSFWVYPCVVHWLWSGTGWMSPFNVTADGPAIHGGVIDFAGSGVVHMVGGFSGLMGAFFLGPRLGRFDKGSSMELKQQFSMGHSVPFQVLGTFILWFGWYGFNPGSTLLATGVSDLAAKVAVNTTIAGAIGGLTVALIARYVPGGSQHWSVPSLCNGILAGLVSITAPCAVVSPWASLFIGLIGGIFYCLSSSLLEKLKIDDPLDAFSVHGVGGMWGVICIGIFAYDKDAIAFGGYGDEVVNVSQGYRFGVQLMAVFVIASWTVVNAGALFFLLNRLGILRVDAEHERSGLDVTEHGGKGRSYASGYIEKASGDGGQKKKMAAKNFAVVEEEDSRGQNTTDGSTATVTTLAETETTTETKTETTTAVESEDNDNK